MLQGAVAVLSQLRSDPRVRVLYLVLVAVGVFFLSGPLAVTIVLALQIVLALAVGIPSGQLARQATRFWLFGAFLLATFALTTQDPEIDRWREIAVAGLTISVNLTGTLAGVTMILRILTILVVSQVVRAGDPRAVAAGLGRLGVPDIAAASIDTVLALFGDGGSGGGGGRGGGRGRGRGEPDSEEKQEPALARFRAAFGQLASGDVRAITDRLERQIGRAEELVRSQGKDRSRELAQDIAVIAGMTLTMLGIRILKILPAIPFAPGHKLVLLTPLYILAGLRTHSRAGSTMTGLTMGVVSFLMGDGRYGVFEIAKHVAPGVICDLFLPILARGGRRPGPVVWSLFGGFIAAGRFATIFAIVLVAQAPAFAYAILLPGLTVHVVFGILSGYVSHHMVRAMGSSSVSPSTPGKNAELPGRDREDRAGRPKNKEIA